MSGSRDDLYYLASGKDGVNFFVDLFNDDEECVAVSRKGLQVKKKNVISQFHQLSVKIRRNITLYFC